MTSEGKLGRAVQGICKCPDSFGAFGGGGIELVSITLSLFCGLARRSSDREDPSATDMVNNTLRYSNFSLPH